MYIPYFCVIKLYYPSNYLGMAVYYPGKKFITFAHGDKHICHICKFGHT